MECIESQYGTPYYPTYRMRLVDAIDILPPKMQAHYLDILDRYERGLEKAKEELAKEER